MPSRVPRLVEHASGRHLRFFTSWITPFGHRFKWKICLPFARQALYGRHSLTIRAAETVFDSAGCADPRINERKPLLPNLPVAHDLPQTDMKRHAVG
jgi:hypothetical protein